LELERKYLSLLDPLPYDVDWTDLKGAEYRNLVGRSMSACQEAWLAYPDTPADLEFLAMPMVRSFIAY
jgi:hypothetical protein